MRKFIRAKKKKNKTINYLKLKVLIFVTFVLSIYFLTIKILDVKIHSKRYNIKGYKNSEEEEIKPINDTKDYENNKFAIISLKSEISGLFSFYNYYIGWVNRFILEEYIPILDLKTFNNTYNGHNTSINYNPWECFFEQPFGYKLEDVLQKAKHIKYIKVDESTIRIPECKIYYNKYLINYWHNIGKQYIPIKKEIIKEADIIREKLFHKSKNILGVMIRGTDYKSLRPVGHPITPNMTTVISDIYNMNSKYKYDGIFFSSEDEQIKEIIKNEFKDKIKFLENKNKINYTKRTFFGKQKGVFGNIEFAKTYLMNIYILSKSIDIIMSRTSGAAGLICLANGFRHSIIYNYGNYR